MDTISKKWDLASIIIGAASIVAIVSLFLPWVDIMIMQVSGFQQQGYIFLILFIYPCYIALAQKSMNKIFGLISSGLALVGIILYGMSKTVQVSVFAQSTNVSASGLYLFGVCSAALVLGVILYPNKK